MDNWLILHSFYNGLRMAAAPAPPLHRSDLGENRRRQQGGRGGFGGSGLTGAATPCRVTPRGSAGVEVAPAWRRWRRRRRPQRRGRRGGGGGRADLKEAEAKAEVAEGVEAALAWQRQAVKEPGREEGDADSWFETKRERAGIIPRMRSRWSLPCFAACAAQAAGANTVVVPSQFCASGVGQGTAVDKKMLTRSRSFVRS
jgi:hypothetical protein